LVGWFLPALQTCDHHYFQSLKESRLQKAKQKTKPSEEGWVGVGTRHVFTMM
jgi:hypothetical protein